MIFFNFISCHPSSDREFELPKKSSDKFNGCNSIKCQATKKLPDLNSFCNPPDCSKLNHYQFLYPHPDPTKFYQCQPKNSFGDWKVTVRDCGRETYFNYNDQTCVHSYQWVSQCIESLSEPSSCEEDSLLCLGGFSPSLSSTSTITSLRSNYSTTQISKTITETSSLSKPKINLSSLFSKMQTPCKCFCWCPCSIPEICWFPCLCNANNCSCL